jgi:hypothetical protein
MHRNTPASTPSAFLGALGPDKSVLLAAVRLSAQRAVEQQFRHFTMAVPALGNLQGLIEDVFGEPFTRVIGRDYQVDLNGFRVHLATKRRPPAVRGPVVAFFTPPEQTRALLTDRHTTDLVFVPWTDDDVTEFQKRAPHAQQF